MKVWSNPKAENKDLKKCAFKKYIEDEKLNNITYNDLKAGWMAGTESVACVK